MGMPLFISTLKDNAGRNDTQQVLKINNNPIGYYYGNWNTEKLSLVKKEHIFITLKKGGHNRSGGGMSWDGEGTVPY